MQAEREREQVERTIKKNENQFLINLVFFLCMLLFFVHPDCCCSFEYCHQIVPLEMDDVDDGGSGACIVAKRNSITCRNKFYYLYDYKMLAEMMRKRGK